VSGTLNVFSNVVGTAGRGVGGAVATLRFSFEGAELEMNEAPGSLIDPVLSLTGVTAVHIGVVDPEMTGVPTNEREMRQATNEDIFDAVLIVEGIGRRELEAVIADIEAQLGPYTTPDTSIDSGIYDLAFLLEADAP